jgi:hypothetical protein
MRSTRGGFDLGHRLLAVLVIHLVAVADELEPGGAVLLVGAAGGFQFFQVFAVDVGALALAVGTEIAAHARALVPVQAEPLERVVDDVEKLL